MTSQLKRGGGTVCALNKQISTLYRNAINGIECCNSNRNIQQQTNPQETGFFQSIKKFFRKTSSNSKTGDDFKLCNLEDIFKNNFSIFLHNLN